MSAVHPLFRLSQRPLTLEDDPRGRPLLDTDGRRIGHVHDVIVQDRSIEEAGSLDSRVTPLFLEVGSGHHFARGERLALVPMGEVTIAGGAVRINGDRFDLFGPDGALTATPKTFSGFGA
ncbi:MAG TPA: PRC-barrel domain-containing protein [Dehalococcoidia bacterium]|nr:PRC-barrel domain-containing protein [Dehalococcoidia bacterium]